MVSLRNTAVLAAATLATSNAVKTLPVTAEEAQMLELSVYVRDIADHMQQYLSFRQKYPDQPYPAILNTVVLEAAGSSGDSWTSLLTGIDPSTVQMMLTGVPWYSSRIYPALTSRFAEAGVVVEGIDASSAAASTSTTSSAAATSSSSSKAASSSSAAVSSSSSAAASSSSKAASSSAAVTSSAASSSAAKATSSASMAQAISQISDGQIQATHTVEQQTNGGAKVVAGLGAGALAAAALLI